MNQPRATWGNDGFVATSGWQIVFCFDANSKEYTHTDESWVSFGGGLPANCCMDGPPAPLDGKAVVRVDDAWGYRDDHRGKTSYNKSNQFAFVVDYLGPIDKEFTLIAPKTPCDEWDAELGIWDCDVEQRRVMLISDVSLKRWLIETGGITAGGHPIATDRESQAQLNGAYTSLKAGLIQDTPWKDASGQFNLVTLVELEPVAKAVASHVRACFEAESVHAAAINILSTQEELDSYDVNSGWPSTVY